MTLITLCGCDSHSVQQQDESHGCAKHHVICYSNFDKGHFKDFHRVQCNEPSPLALDNFSCFSLIST